MIVALPDPVEFTTEVLSRRGALVDGAMAILPPDLARALSLAEELRLSSTGEESTVGCGIGTPLLEALVGEARGTVPVAAARVRAPAPRAAQALNLAERLVVRNGVSAVGGAQVVEALYVAAWIAWVAEADERSEGVALVVTHAGDGSVPDQSFVKQCDPHANDLEPFRVAAGDPSRWVTRYAATAVRDAVDAVFTSTARRHSRDHERIAEYYASLIQEARAPRRKIDAAALEAKVTHLIADRDAKLRDLTDRFSLRVSMQIAAALWVVAPAVEATISVKRRKAQRDIRARLPTGAHELDRIPCEGCDRATLRPAFCDDRMHLLCEVCVPVATGRPDCPACASKA